jgi:hypothetical protein
MVRLLGNGLLGNDAGKGASSSLTIRWISKRDH